MHSPHSPRSATGSPTSDVKLQLMSENGGHLEKRRHSRNSVSKNGDYQNGTTQPAGVIVGVDDARNNKITLPLIVLIFAGALGMLSFGYELSVFNAPGPIVESWINTSYADRGATYHAEDGRLLAGVSPSRGRLIYALAVAAFAVGGVIGAPAAGPLAERFGRKRAQLLNCMVTLIAAPLIALGGFIHRPELVIAGRFLIGISNAAATVLGPLYLSECSPRGLRGSIGICNQVGACTGILLAQILGLPILLGTKQAWPALFLVVALVPLIQIIMLLLSPESPRYLFITKHEKIEATQALRRLRPRDVDIGNEVSELEHEAHAMKSIKHATIGQLFSLRRYMWPLSVAIVMHFSQVLSGVNGIIGYSSILFRDAGLSADSASYANLAIGTIMLIMAFVTLALIDRLGRRALHLVGMAGIIVFGICITIFSALPQIIQSDSATGFFQMANIASVFLFLILFALGPASIPWMIVAELFGQEARGPANSIACLFNWICQVITFLGFPIMQGFLGAYVYVPFVVLMIFFFVFLYKYMPETNGRTFEEVAAIFERY